MTVIPSAVSYPAGLSAGDAGGGPAAVVAFETPVVVRGRRRMVFNDPDELCVIALAESGHEDGGAVTVLVESALGIVLAAPCGVSGAGVGDDSRQVVGVDPGTRYIVQLFQDGDATTGSIRAIVEADIVAPTVEGAVVNGSTPGQLVVTCSKLVAVRSLNGVTLSDGRTITGVVAGNGTSTLTFGVSPVFAAHDDAPDLQVASSNGIVSLSGKQLASGTTTLELLFLTGLAGILPWVRCHEKNRGQTTVGGASRPAAVDTWADLMGGAPLTRDGAGGAILEVDGSLTFHGDIVERLSAELGFVPGAEWGMYARIENNGFSFGYAVAMDQGTGPDNFAGAGGRLLQIRATTKLASTEVDVDVTPPATSAPRDVFMWRKAGRLTLRVDSEVVQDAADTNDLSADDRLGVGAMEFSGGAFQAAFTGRVIHVAVLDRAFEDGEPELVIAGRVA